MNWEVLKPVLSLVRQHLASVPFGLSRGKSRTSNVTTTLIRYDWKGEGNVLHKVAFYRIARTDNDDDNADTVEGQEAKSTPSDRTNEEEEEQDEETQQPKKRKQTKAAEKTVELGWLKTDTKSRLVRNILSLFSSWKDARHLVGKTDQVRPQMVEEFDEANLAAGIPGWLLPLRLFTLCGWPWVTGYFSRSGNFWLPASSLDIGLLEDDPERYAPSEDLDYSSDSI